MSTETAHVPYRIGYARISTTDQDESLQLDTLTKAGCSKVFTDKASGMLQQRPALDELLGQLRPGDVVVIWRLDRLARSLKHLLEIVALLERKNVGLQSICESIDTTSPAGKLTFHVLGSVAQFERDLLIERTQAGLAAARARGRNGGRPQSGQPRSWLWPSPCTKAEDTTLPPSPGLSAFPGRRCIAFLL